MILLPIDRNALRVFKVPRKDILKIIKSLDLYEQDSSQEILKLPAKMAIRSVFAWSFLMTYRESPTLVVVGLFAVIFVIPFVFFLRLFS